MELHRLPGPYTAMVGVWLARAVTRSFSWYPLASFTSLAVVGALSL